MSIACQFITKAFIFLILTQIMYNQYQNRGSYTFQTQFRPPFNVPPPPITDEVFVKKNENVVREKKIKPKYNISEVRESLRIILTKLNNLKEINEQLNKDVVNLTDNEWQATLATVTRNKTNINKMLQDLTRKLDALRKLLAKRAAKRLRLKRLCGERKREKQAMIKNLEERSRKIDENLQKIKDDINKAKQEEAAKLQADVVLKDVLRKKHDARKCIVKLDAMIRLRKARANTAKGRGVNLSENDAVAFNANIEKLKSLWLQKQAMYEKEEMDLRTTLSSNSEVDSQNATEHLLKDNLVKWREAMFGGELPQADFDGNIGMFINIRSQWDNYLHSDGSPLPTGWLLPNAHQ